MSARQFVKRNTPDVSLRCGGVADAHVGSTKVSIDWFAAFGFGG
jgi:hypothetical protein